MDDADAIALVVVVVVVDAIKTTRKANLEKERFHHRGCSYRMAIIERSLNVLCFAVEHFEFMGSSINVLLSLIIAKALLPLLKYN